MKQRRTLIIALLLVAALALGIGYAALSRDLQINGSANLQGNNDDFQIYFTEGSADSDAATVTANEGTTTASYVIDGLSEVGDTVEITFEVLNDTEDVYAHLNSITSTTGELVITTASGDVTGNYADYFSKEMVITNENGDVYADGEDFIVEPGKTATVTITITLEKTVTDPVSATSFIALHFSGTN